MSNKKWRTPADGMDAVKDEYQRQAKEALDQQAAGLKEPTGEPELDRGLAALDMSTGELPETTTGSGTGNPAGGRGGSRSERTDESHCDSSEAATVPEQPAATTTAMGEDTQATPMPFGGPGGGHPDMRVTPGLLRGPDRITGVLGEFEVFQMLGDVQRFLWKMIRVTGEIVDSIPIGELRRVVAEELAMPGDIVDMDGKLTKGVTACAQADHRKGPRGSSHPLVKLLNFALQSAKLLRQYNSGTHPAQHNKAMRREMLDAIKRAEKWAYDLIKGKPKPAAAG